MRGSSRKHRTRSACPPGDSLPLSLLEPGEHGTIVGLAAGRALRGRMATLGFTPGADVSIIQNFGRGPLIALVRGARIALGRGEAARVRVRRGQP